MMMETKRVLGADQTIILVPTPELIPDFLNKLSVKVPDKKEDMVRLANMHGIYSVIDLRNKMRNGRDLAHIRYILIDEAHHDDADSWEQVYLGLQEGLVRIGFTATPYCGTPQRTYEFRKKWDEIIYATTLQAALADGVITYPNIVVEPLVNDDILTVRGGEFVIEAVTAEFESKIEHAIDIARTKYGWWGKDGQPNKTTILGVPSSRVFEHLEEVAQRQGVKLLYITQATTFKQRQRYFQQFRDREASLVHINVISEGKDLRVRNYLDMAPCMSPRLFFQRFGRCTRPLGENESTDAIGDYLCTNRNVERHCYLFDNTLPYEQVNKAVLAFKEPSTRTGVRAFGIESLGRIKPTSVKLSNGLTVTIYNVSQTVNKKKEVFVCMLHPLTPTPYWFKQTAGLVREGAVSRMAYATWTYMGDPPIELRGYRSSNPTLLTERQMAMWKKHATDRGLDVDQKVDAKKFALLPVLINSGVSLA